MKKTAINVKVFSVLVAVFTLVYISVSAAQQYTDKLYVSDMDWVSSTSHASNTVKKDLRFDGGGQLSINGVTYEHGIGTHACDTGQPDAEVVINIPEGYVYFEAYVGLDTNMSPSSGSGSVEFIVIQDGQQLATSGILAPGQDAYHLTTKISGGQQLILRLTNGGDSAAYDAANWCDAAIYKVAESETETQSNPKTGDAIFIPALILSAAILAEVTKNRIRS